MRADLDAMIELERKAARGDPDRDTRFWADKLAEVDRRRTRYQEMAADDLISFDELRAKLTELDDTRRTAEQELTALQNRRERLFELERDRDALLDELADVVPEALDALASEDRHRLYKMLKLRVMVNADRSLEISGAFKESLSFRNHERFSPQALDRNPRRY